jgi:CRP-like cAMP-binding protein
MAFRDKFIRLSRTMALFQGLSPEEVEGIMTHGLTEAVHKDTVIFKKGTVGRKMYVILNGCVNIIDEGAVFATLTTGETFGEMALLSHEPRSATAVAAESTSLFALTAHTFEELLTKRVAVRLLLNISRTLCERLRDADEVMARRL